jgi:hypothetical protein
MDVYCANCGEPWDLSHLRNDEVHETAAGTEMIYDKIDMEKWDEEMCKYGGLSREAALRACPKPEPKYKGEPWTGQLTDFWRREFKALGWEFGGNLAIVLRCNCCEANGPREDAEDRRADYETIDSLLGDDLDGAAVEVNDLERTRAHVI